MTLLLAVSYVFFVLRRLLTYLHLFQQEEYDGIRFIRSIFARKRLDRRATMLLALLALLSTVAHIPRWILYASASAVLLAVAFLEQDPRKSGKKSLAMTKRARRTIVTATALAALWVILSVAIFNNIWIWIVSVQTIPFWLVVANYILSPFETLVQRRLLREAHDKILAIKPKTIGITGSFGKTSVKHIIAHILETQASTLMTPGSVNTPMGITRVIREQLSSSHRFFVCEMGAYGVGSIAKLTALAPPDLGVIISIGKAHFERFRTLDTVARAKFELAESVVKNSGKVIVGEGALEQPAAKAFAMNHRENLVIVGTGESCDARIVELKQSDLGIEVSLAWKSGLHVLRAPLFGEHQALNIALSFAAACELGVSAGDAIIALTSVPQIKHRLEVKRQPSGWVKIDDAYNSNRVGFESALKLLGLLHRDGGRRILISPGMVELGTSHDREHERIGKAAASYVDVLIAIMPERIPTLIPAYRMGNPHGEIRTFSTFAEASQWLDSNVTSLDVVLIENDLPDIYEKKLKL